MSWYLVFWCAARTAQWGLLLGGHLARRASAPQYRGVGCEARSTNYLQAVIPPSDCRRCEELECWLLRDATRVVTRRCGGVVSRAGELRQGTEGGDGAAVHYK
jgi:hypothetical protein